MRYQHTAVLLLIAVLLAFPLTAESRLAPRADSRVLSLEVGALSVAEIAAGMAAAETPLERGDVLAYTQTPQVCDPCRPNFHAAVLAPDGEVKRELAPVIWPRSAYAPGPLFLSDGRSVIVSHDGATIAARLLTDLNSASLGEIVATRSGDLLVAETSPRNHLTCARIIRFTTDGRVLAVHDLPPEVGGARRIELLSDQCTLVYTRRWDDRILRRFNVCTGAPEADLFRIPDDALLIGAIRQLPNGHLLIATGTNTRRFDLRGTQLETYPVPATDVALTPDGSGFWASWKRSVARIDFAAPQLIAVQTSVQYDVVAAFAVVGEWRAATHTPSPPRTRAIRRR